MFIDNVTVQVIERHIMNGLEDIFSPLAVSMLADEIIEGIASENTSDKKKREYYEEQIKKLEGGQRVFRSMIGSTV